MRRIIEGIVRAWRRGFGGYLGGRVRDAHLRGVRPPPLAVEALEEGDDVARVDEIHRQVAGASGSLRALIRGGELEVEEIEGPPQRRVDFTQQPPLFDEDQARDRCERG